MKRLGFCFGMVAGLAVSCATQRAIGDEQHSFTIHNLATETKMAVVERGDWEAFESLEIGYMNFPFPGEILPYAMLMANRYASVQGAYSVFDCLAFHTYEDDVSAIDAETANLAVRYLLRAASAGHEQAIEEVREFGVVYDEASNREQIIRLVQTQNGWESAGKPSPSPRQ